MLNDKYTDLLKQAEEIVKQDAFKNTKHVEYVQYLVKLRADGKPFYEKETAYLQAFVANPEKTEAPTPPGIGTKIIAGAVLFGALASAVVANLPVEQRRWRTA